MEDPLADAVDEDPLKMALELEFAGILTPEEIAEARLQARKQLDADARKTAKQAIIEAEIHRLKVKTGDGYLDEEIWVNIDLPPFADRIVVDGVTFFHNHPYKRPRHVVNSLRETMARAWDHEADIKGESMQQKIGAYRVKNFGQIDGSKSISAKGFNA